MRPCAPVSSRPKLKDWSPGRDKCQFSTTSPPLLWHYSSESPQNFFVLLFEKFTLCYPICHDPRSEKDRPKIGDSVYYIFESYTYNLLLTAILRSQGLRIERDDNAQDELPRLARQRRTRLAPSEPLRLRHGLSGNAEGFPSLNPARW
jgi:hypothetical protein